MKIVIIEDEKPIALDLIKTISELKPEAKIIAVLHSLEEANDFFEQSREIDLIFSDIQLGDGVCFDLFSKLHLDIPIVFCTAYNQYALQAFEELGIDYILKPFSKKDIQKAFDKYEVLKPSSRLNELNLLLSNLNNIQSKNSSIIINQGDKIFPIKSEQIAFFRISNSVVYLVTLDKKDYRINKKMEDLEIQFSNHFFRVNRQYLVNKSAIKSASRYYNQKLLIHLTIDYTDQIFVTKERVSDFIAWLSK